MAAKHVSRNCRLGDLNAEFQKFSMYSRRTPERVRQAHFSHELSSLLVNSRASVPTAFPAPVVTKSLPMPADNCIRPHNMQDTRPVRLKLAQYDPEQSVRIAQARSGATEFQGCQLLTQCQILKSQVAATAGT